MKPPLDDYPKKKLKTKTLVHPKYQRLHTDMLTVFRIHANEYTAQELLAVASQIVGQLMAVQDQRDPDAKEKAITVVMENIETGSRLAIESFISLPVKGQA